MKILTIVGARPQFIKAAIFSKEVIQFNKDNNHEVIYEEIIHTGQHYDKDMSDIFFKEMGIPRPVKRFNFGGLGHAEMTAKMMIEIEKEIINRNPDYVLIYGDTNSTLSGAIVLPNLTSRLFMLSLV